MPDLLGVTNPVPNYDNLGNNRPMPSSAQNQDPRIQNIPDPSRVTRADNRTERQGADDPLVSNGPRYDSNLQTFLQQLRDAPDLAGVMARTLMWMRGAISTPGLTQGVAEDMAALFRFLQMDAESFQQFFLEQMQAGNRFSGPIFSLLRQAYQGMNQETAREAILNFARRFSDFSSTEHISATMMSLLRQISERLPKSWRGQLSEMLAQLQNGLQAGSRGENIKLLQGQILPYLGSYVSQTRDLGHGRTLMSLLMLNIARYENGSEEGLLAAFRQLAGYGEALAGLNQLDDAAILKLLRENAFTRAARAQEFAQQMAQTAGQALRGRFGAEAQEGFQEILRAMLLNESVYMPLQHTILPLEWNGKMMYSELWVDPDAEEKDKSGKEGGEKIQFLFKMDVQSLGFLEMTLAARKDQVDIDLYAPETVERHGKLIAEDLETILTSHGLTGRHIQVERRERALTLTEVFPGLFDGKRSVNVKV